MDSLAMPRLRHCTLLAGDDHAPLTLVVGTEYFQLTETAGTRDVFLRVKSCFDGRHTIPQIAAKTGVSESAAASVAEAFAGAGLLRRDEGTSELATGAFLARLRATCQMWRRQIGYHRLFRGLLAGEFRAEVLLGLLLETMHYVASAPHHIATALAHCQRPEWRGLLSSYLADERGHEEYVIETLANLGMSGSLVRSAHPLIGTQSLIGMLSDIGRTSTLAYLACTMLFESSAAEFEESRRVFESIAAQYGHPPEAVAPLLKHMRDDVEANHTALLEAALAGHETVPAADAHAAVNALHDFKHAWDQYHDQIVSYYTDISNYVPRLKVDYFSL